MAVRANSEQSPNSVPMMGQRRVRLTSIEPAMGCDAGPTLNRYWVGRPTLCVPGISYRRVVPYTDLSTLVVEGIGLHVKDIAYLSPWFFQLLYPGHLGFLPMKKTNVRSWTQLHIIGQRQSWTAWQNLWFWARILVQVTIYCRLLIGRDGHLDQSEAYDIS